MMLELKQTRYRYHQEWFEFTLGVKQGEILSLIGPSGAGKSTLLAMVSGFCEPESGEILIGGQSMLPLEPHQRPLAMLFQDNNLFEHLTVQDNIVLGIHPSLKRTPEVLNKVKEAASKVGLQDYLSRLPSELSGGQKQRVALARCFVQSRPLWLLDEPFSALDPLLRKEMLSVVKNLAEDNAITVVMVTHHLNDAKAIAHRFAYLSKGSISMVGNIEALNSHHDHAELAKFVLAAQH